MKPSQIKIAVLAAMEENIPVMIWGPPGIGKSAIMRQIVQGINDATPKPKGKAKGLPPFELRDERLAYKDPTEVSGFPVPNHDSRRMDWYTADFMPTDPNSRGVIFFDELPNATQATQNTAYQLFLDRRIRNDVLPAGWKVVGAGNRTTDRAGTHVMSTALASRMIHLDMEADLEDWITQAIADGISDGTRGYLRWRPGNLSTTTFTAGMRAFPTPRSWYTVDKIMRRDDLPQDVKMGMVAGKVGEGLAAEYFGYMREQRLLPNLDKILMHPDDVPVPESMSSCYAIVSALESKASSTNIERLMKYVKRMPKEFEVVFMSSAIKRDTDIENTTAFITWLRENSGILT